jgi:hypothetical protein
VVALEIVVGDDLPVRRLRTAGPRGEAAQIGDPVAIEQLAQPFALLGEGVGERVEVDEDKAAEDLDARREQAERSLVELGIALVLGDAEQAPVLGVVGPAVVAAADRAFAGA